MLRALRHRLSFEIESARHIVERVFEAHPTRDFAVRLWDGTEVGWGIHRTFTLVFTDPQTFQRCFSSRDPSVFAQAYVDGRVLVEGDLWAAIGLASYLRTLELGLRDKLRIVPGLVVPASSHTVGDDTRDVRAHYDLPDELFRLYLDTRRVYSCAYFATPDQSLELAQQRKLDLVCRKLDLQPGEQLLDIGCGWGALVIWAARHYGVYAHGITLSENQARDAREQVAAAGLDDRVRIDVGHYADLGGQSFDKISSIGMYEHVGRPKLGRYLSAVYAALGPGGLFLNHGITEPTHRPKQTGGAFIYRTVFPGAELAPVAELQEAMEQSGFEILDVQSLRPHYALTLQAWFERFRAKRAEAARLISDRVLRTWELYLAGCSQAFDEGLLSVHQILLAKPDRDGHTRAPLTRAETLLFTEGSRGSDRHRPVAATPEPAVF